MSHVDFVCRCRFGCADPAEEPQYEYVRIADPTEDISLLIGAEDPIVPEQEISIKYEYPLKETISFSHKNENGFSRADLARCVSDDYQKIYRDQPKKISGSDYTSQLNYLVLRGLNGQNGSYQADVFS